MREGEKGRGWRGEDQSRKRGREEEGEEVERRE